MDNFSRDCETTYFQDESFDRGCGKKILFNLGCGKRMSSSGDDSFGRGCDKEVLFGRGCVKNMRLSFDNSSGRGYEKEILFGCGYGKRIGLVTNEGMTQTGWFLMNGKYGRDWGSTTDL
ncbi:hypothetical protein LR48_Vigan11g138800 [Vigna angularis]|uniref:Uncharacterized protein n=1 Tax=Phaseolus angularis TaxID=3914 RepID=A0A0L9VUA7_PHAAN|nr:hypothetical protein LR48_Vigan11g138800 [Vigna angularis]